SPLPPRSANCRSACAALPLRRTKKRWRMPLLPTRRLPIPWTVKSARWCPSRVPARRASRYCAAAPVSRVKRTTTALDGAGPELGPALHIPASDQDLVPPTGYRAGGATVLQAARKVAGGRLYPGTGANAQCEATADSFQFRDSTYPTHL